MIIPALDIINGKIVRLYQGNYCKKTIYGNPMLILQKYITQGTKMIHLVDLTGAQNPKNRQISLINQLIQEISPSLHVQIGGGIRSASDIEILLKSGATRVVLGSMAITHPKIVKKWFKIFDPNTLVLAIDVRVYSQNNYIAMIHGWQTETNIQLQEIIQNYSSVNLKHILCTDIAKDGTLLGSNIDLYQSICSNWPNISFQASGGIMTLSEIPKLYKSGVSSIIIGRAFLEKKFTIHEAISCWQNA